MIEIDRHIPQCLSLASTLLGLYKQKQKTYISMS
jgi:hypothetical protein